MVHSAATLARPRSCGPHAHPYMQAPTESHRPGRIQYPVTVSVQVGPSIAGWMAQTEVQSNSWIADAGVFTQTGGLVRVSELPGQLHAFFVLAAYIAVLGSAALWLIRRRDIAGAKGE